MPTCVVKCCSRSTLRDKKEKGITFHRFPKESEWRKDWIQIIRECRIQKDWNPTKSSVVCSEHFETSDLYTTKGGLIRVVTFGVPQKFLLKPPRDEQQNEQPSIPEKSFESIAASSHEATSNTVAGTSTAGSLRCNFCSSPLQKIYKCVQCEDVLLCDNCERSDRHPIHCVLRIASEQLYVKVKGTFPTLHRLFNMLLNEDKDSSDGDSEEDNTRSAAEFDLNDEKQKTNEVCSNVKYSTINSQINHIKCHSKVKSHKIFSGTTDIGKSRKRKPNTLAGDNMKKPKSAQEVNTTIDATTINLTQTSSTYNDPLNIDYNIIKTEPAEEDNTANMETMDTTEVSIEYDIKQEVKEEPDDEDVSDEVPAATVTYLCRAPNNTK